MNEEFIQRGLDKNNPTSKIGKWNYYSIGATNLKALKQADIIRNVDYGMLENKKVDGIIVGNKEAIAIVEFKRPDVFRTEAQKNKAVLQEIDVARILGCKIIIATDGTDTIWVNALTNKRICDESDIEILAPFDPSNEHIATLIEKIYYSINEKNNKILPKKLVNPTDLAKSIWQDIWSVSGATPENCLYTFVELFIFKYLSDLNILKNTYSFGFLINMTSTNTEEEILQYYADVIRKKIKELFPYGSDNTTIINGTIFVSKDQQAVSGYSAVFVKILKKFFEYGKLDNIDYDFKSQLFESFLKESISKKNWGQFFTPMKVVRAIEKIAKDEIREGIKICDPACGVGKFLLEPIKNKIPQFYKIVGDAVIPKITIRGFDKGFDKDEQKTIILAKANMLIYLSEIIKEYPTYTKEFGEIFNHSFILKTNSILGTLKDPIKNEYDLILTNPPYVTSGSSNLKEEIGKDAELKKYYKINAMGVEGLFMEWIIRALKPNGKAFIVVPDGIFNRQNDKNLREFIKTECYLDGIISLPTNTFFTTSKKTYILCITKKNNKSDVQNDPVFTYLVSEIGESRDIYRFDIDQNDLEEATTLYNFFKGNKVNFRNFNKDPRCKVIAIDKFDPCTNWSIDRWWTKEEKIELGIEEKNQITNFEEIPTIIEEVADTLSNIGSMIKGLEKTKNNQEQSYKTLSILDKDFFVLTRGKRITKEEINQNKGEVPVYSSSKFENSVLGFISYDYLKNKKLVTETDPSILFNLDGSVGYCFVKKDKLYSFIDVVASLKPKTDKILLEYLKIVLESEIKKTGADYSTKLYFNQIANYNIEFRIPTTPDGNFDIKAQEEVIKKYNLINELKAKLTEYKENMESLQIKIDNRLNF